MAIRVLRLIEIVYETPERAEEDMGNWTHNLSLKGLRMRSATLPFEAVEWAESKDAIGMATPLQDYNG